MSSEEKSNLSTDKEGGIRRLGGDEDIYSELMDLFIDQSTEQIEELKEAVRNNSASSIEKIAHSIKGAAANLCVPQVQQYAFELEQIGNENDLAQAEQSLNKLINEMDRVKRYWTN